MTAEVATYSPTQAEIDDGARASEWVVATTDPNQLVPLQTQGWESIRPAGQAITDDYPDVLRFARFGSWLTAR
jgi:hypothetical protein